MKRLITLSLALVLVFALATSLLVPKEAEAVAATLTGIPLAIEFGGTLQIQYVLIEVKRGWLNGAAFELDIEITGVNGVPQDHGHRRVPLSSGTVFSADRDIAHVVIPWDDPGSQNTDETYTVTVQVLAQGTPLGFPISRPFE
ncbi:MAG: hypothetical protein OEV49_15575 [candidate division Zixibacteria bacterium]|nr:hypothetical protein [candidate division Zixibacteria bacterium]MDH3938503.1 hypothetical protein [candidate division Zixibacteria bacterium]MDH4035660.1 hypothetical protein [candidate division Zixibacteria bacterium]